MAVGHKTGGRKKGSKNKHSFQVEEIAQRYELEPFEFAMAVMNNDWKLLGFENPNKVIIGEKAGIEFSIEEPNVKLAERIKCAEFASKYLYSPKQAIDPKTGDSVIRVIVEDYKKKE